LLGASKEDEEQAVAQARNQNQPVKCQNTINKSEDYSQNVEKKVTEDDHKHIMAIANTRRKVDLKQTEVFRLMQL
jgi:hypothetical protein